MHKCHFIPYRMHVLSSLRKNQLFSDYFNASETDNFEGYNAIYPR